MKTLEYVVALCCVFVSVYGHGRLLDPAGRSSLWRFGLSDAVNYNDNQLFCGGFGVSDVVSRNAFCVIITQ